jgi:hypothetical protein
VLLLELTISIRENRSSLSTLEYGPIAITRIGQKELQGERQAQNYPRDDRQFPPVSGCCGLQVITPASLSVITLFFDVTVR